MLRNTAIICLFAVVLVCFGCSEQANLQLSGTSQTAMASGHNCKTPDCFFEQYPENWEHTLYQRQLTHGFQQEQLAQK